MLTRRSSIVGPPINIWGVGVLVNPFLRGGNHPQQLKYTLAIVKEDDSDDPEDQDDLEQIETHEVNLLRTPYSQFFKIALHKCLIYHPDKRITARELVKLTSEAVEAYDSGLELGENYIEEKSREYPHLHQL
jgi:hypothetical protein